MFINPRMMNPYEYLGGNVFDDIQLASEGDTNQIHSSNPSKNSSNNLIQIIKSRLRKILN